MSTCKHKWKTEPFAGSVKCLKCDYVEFNVAGECLSLQAKVEAMQEHIQDLTNAAGIRDLPLVFCMIEAMQRFLPEKE